VMCIINKTQFKFPIKTFILLKKFVICKLIVNNLTKKG
jgi:hypothetical protein